MGPRFEIKIDAAAIRRVQAMAGDIPDALPRIVPRAMNRTADWTKVRMKREVAAQLGMKVSDAAQLIPVHHAARNDWYASANIYNARVPLIRFAIAQESTGVSYRTMEGYQFMPHAFFARMETGHRGIFLRSRYAKFGAPVRREKRTMATGYTQSGQFDRATSRRSWWTELPIYERFLYIHKVIVTGFLEPLADEGRAQLTREFDSQTKRLIAQRAK